MVIATKLTRRAPGAKRKLAAPKLSANEIKQEIAILERILTKPISEQGKQAVMKTLNELQQALSTLKVLAGKETICQTK